MNRLLFIAIFSSAIFYSGCSTNTPAQLSVKKSSAPSVQTTAQPVAALNSSVAAAPSLITLDSSQIFEIYSPINHQTYRIRIRLPDSYASNPSKQYPIVIKVDGQWDFLLAASAYNCVYFDGQMPETIFVGIDWANVEGNVHALRSRDLLPAPISAFANSGHAKTFIDVITQEIIPELSNRFRLDGHRFLLGGSWGGTFVTYALLEQPDAFDGAIAIAGDYEEAADTFTKQIQALNHSDKLKGKRLYIGIGQWDSVAPSVLKYANELKSTQLTGFQLKVDSLQGFGHSGMNIPGYAGGYQFLFERPKLKLSKSQLNKFAGTYKSSGANSREINVSVESDGLVVHSAGDETYLLLALSENSFYHPGIFYNLMFNDNQARLETFFGKTDYIKVDAKH